VADPRPHEGGGRNWRRAKCDPLGYVARRVGGVCIAGAAPDPSEWRPGGAAQGERGDVAVDLRRVGRYGVWVPCCPGAVGSAHPWVGLPAQLREHHLPQDADDKVRRRHVHGGDAELDGEHASRAPTPRKQAEGPSRN